tara:strand:+ start:2434 stop:3090 length:657 start_codon:yes stop_codon:yes gene_type:complete
LKDKNIITVDGPSASGKGSLAKGLAEELGFLLLDSGLLYRAYSYCFDKTSNHSDAKDLFSNLRIDNIDQKMHVFEDNDDITQILRNENIAKSASKLSSLRETRDNLIVFQRDLAGDHGLVADGRDMGTVVFPDAKTKIFLVADELVRAKRRYDELILNNSSITISQVVKDIRNRDDADQKRNLSPLAPAKDALLIDSSDLTEKDVLEIAIKYYTDCIN